VINIKKDGVEKRGCGGKKSSQRLQQFIGRREYSLKGCGKALGCGRSIFATYIGKRKGGFKGRGSELIFKGCIMY
jgi:hypothetical protein